MARGNGLASLVGLLVGGAFGAKGVGASRRERAAQRQERTDQRTQDNARADQELLMRQRAQQADAARAIGSTLAPEGQKQAAALAARVLTGDATLGGESLPAVPKPGGDGVGPWRPEQVGAGALAQGETQADYAKRMAVENLLRTERVGRVGEIAKTNPKAYAQPGRSYEADLQAAANGGEVSVLGAGADLGPSVTDLVQQHAVELEKLRQAALEMREARKREAAQRIADSRLEMAKYKSFADYIGKARRDFSDMGGTAEGMEDFERKQTALWQSLMGGGEGSAAGGAAAPVEIPTPLPREVVPPAGAAAPLPAEGLPAAAPVGEDQDFSYPALVAGSLAKSRVPAVAPPLRRPAPPTMRSGALTAAESPEVTAMKAREAEQAGAPPPASPYTAMFPNGLATAQKLAQGERKLGQGDRRLGQGDRKLDQGDQKLAQELAIENRRLDLTARDVKTREKNVANLIVTRTAQVANAARRLETQGSGGKDSKQTGLVVGQLRRGADNARKNFKDALLGATKDEDTGHLWNGFNPRVESTWPKDPKLRAEAARISQLAEAADAAETRLDDGVNYLTGGQYGKVKKESSPNGTATGAKRLEINEGTIKGQFSFQSRDSLRNAFKKAGYTATEAEAKADKYWKQAK